MKGYDEHLDNYGNPGLLGDEEEYPDENISAQEKNEDAKDE